MGDYRSDVTSAAREKLERSFLPAESRRREKQMRLVEAAEENKCDSDLTVLLTHRHAPVMYSSQGETRNCFRAKFLCWKIKRGVLCWLFYSPKVSSLCVQRRPTSQVFQHSSGESGQ